MKKLLFIIVLLTTLCSCNNIKYWELYAITDEIVEKLQITYEGCGLIGGVI